MSIAEQYGLALQLFPAMECGIVTTFDGEAGLWRASIIPRGRAITDRYFDSFDKMAKHVIAAARQQEGP